MGRHRAALERFLERAVGDAPVIEAARGLADRWDKIENLGESEGQIPQLAAVYLNTCERLSIPHEDVLAALEADLRAV